MDMNFGEWECCRVREEVDKGGGGNWDNCNSIINKIYFKEKKHLLPWLMWLSGLSAGL